MYGEKLKKIRKHLSFTQDQMAEFLEIQYRTYTSYERGENNAPYSMLVLLCNKLNINLNWFIADKGEMFNSVNEQQPSLNIDIEREVVAVMKKYGIIDKQV